MSGFNFAHHDYAVRSASFRRNMEDTGFVDVDHARDADFAQHSDFCRRPHYSQAEGFGGTDGPYGYGR